MHQPSGSKASLVSAMVEMEDHLKERGKPVQSRPKQSRNLTRSSLISLPRTPPSTMHADSSISPLMKTPPSLQSNTLMPTECMVSSSKRHMQPECGPLPEVNVC